MKRLLLCFLCAGCASTTFYDRTTGKPIARFQGDMTGSHYEDGPTKWGVDKVSHSAATRAGGSVIGTASTGISGIIATWLMKGAVK